MSNYNLWTAIGNMTRDPEMRYLPNGTPITTFCLAVNHSWKTSAGEKRTEVLFMECTIFGKGAEVLPKYTARGCPLFITGRLRNEEWQDKVTGSKRAKITCMVEAFQLIGNGKPAEDDPGPSPPLPGIDPADVPPPGFGMASAAPLALPGMEAHVPQANATATRATKAANGFAAARKAIETGVAPEDEDSDVPF